MNIVNCYYIVCKLIQIVYQVTQVHFQKKTNKKRNKTWRMCWQTLGTRVCNGYTVLWVLLGNKSGSSVRGFKWSCGGRGIGSTLLWGTGRVTQRTALCLEIAARALKLSGVCLRNEQGVGCLGGGKNPLFNMGRVNWQMSRMQQEAWDSAEAKIGAESPRRTAVCIRSFICWMGQKRKRIRLKLTLLTILLSLN